MALSIVGAGFGRTGTYSLKMALERLGFGPCHHMAELMEKPVQLTAWRALAAGAVPDWDEIFAGYRASVDWPAAYYWRELADYFSEAKVLLSVRPEESWFKSIQSTILPIVEAQEDEAGESGKAVHVGHALIYRRTFDRRMGDHDHAIQVFRDHIADVQRTIPPERLLTYDVSQGWAPLCAFLERPVPIEPFPHRNQSAEFHGQFGRDE
ncbi:MAG: sulfotransferase family protein [Pseudomonadota bacterium]